MKFKRMIKRMTFLVIIMKTFKQVKYLKINKVTKIKFKMKRRNSKKIKIFYQIMNKLKIIKKGKMRKKINKLKI